MRRLARILGVAIAAVAGSLVLLSPTPAAAHDDRQPTGLTGQGTVPLYRPAGTTLLVCGTDAADFTQRIATFPADVKAANTTLWTQCQKSGQHTLQAALTAVTQADMIIKILPGVYGETAARAAPSTACANLASPRASLGYAILTWEQQQQCPNLQNLVAIQNKKNLQIEGTGAKPTDVIIDAAWDKLMAVRADRSPGLYLRNFTAQHAASTGVYVMESDGVAIDDVVGRWNGEDGVNTFADDHGLISSCETYGNGHAGIAAEATPDTRSDGNRFSVEVRDCASHDNVLGYAGIGGDAVHLHDNTFTGNAAGVGVFSAAAREHPGLPQNHATVEHNVIGNNNADFYRFVRDGTCAKPMPERGVDQGAVCPLVGVPVGAGVVNAGGNGDVWRDNWVYGNAYAGFVSWWVPGYLRANDRVGAQFDTAHDNRYVDNTMGRTKEGADAPNGLDFWWDGQGFNSCWQRSADAGASPRSIPHCTAANQPAGLPSGRYLAEPFKAIKVYVCLRYDPLTNTVPSDCDWYGATGWHRVEVKWAIGEAVLIGLLAVVLWARLLRGRRTGAALVGLLLTLGGLGLGVYGTLHAGGFYGPAGLAALGFGYLLLALPMFRRGRPALGWLTVLLGLFALAGAIDTGVTMVPYLPVPPSIVRLGLELLWLPWAFVAAIRGRVLAGTGSRAGEPERDLAEEPYDPLERFTDALRW